MLAKYGKFGHTIVLYNLTGLVYVIGFILINNFADEKVEALANTFKFNSVEFSLKEVFYIVLGSYFAAPLVYGILLYIYYGVSNFFLCCCNHFFNVLIYPSSLATTTVSSSQTRMPCMEK